MNTMTYNPTVVRQNAIYEKIIDLKNQINIFSPAEDSAGGLYFCTHSGEINSFNDSGFYEGVFVTGGQPNCNILR